MDPRYLKAFVATARLGSFSKAAEELNIAQSAVSRQIKLLEQSVDSELILRSSKQIILTPKGKQLYELSDLFLQGCERIMTESQDRDIRIGIIHGLLETWFHKVIIAFSKEYPNRLFVEINNFKNLEKDLLAGKLDLIFTPKNIQNDLISARRIFDETRDLVSTETINVETLDQYTWITYNSEDILFKLGHTHSKQLIQVNSITSMMRLVQQGIGIAVLPRHLTCEHPELRRFPLPPKYQSSPIYIATLSYVNLPENLSQILEIIKQIPVSP